MRRMLMIIRLTAALSATLSAAVDTVYVHSSSMHKDIPVLIVSPMESRDSLAVVFLLHGYGGGYTDWQKHVNLQPYADQYAALLVCPDATANSWYLDSPEQSDSRYETFTAVELPAFVLHRYPVRKDKKYWAITGLSMGGHGALYLGIRHPERFGQMAAMSGGVDLTWSTKKWEIAQKLGAYETYPQRWHKNSILNMVGQINRDGRPILIDCGVDDIFIDINRSLHQRLLEAGIAHDYCERPGGHSWRYWVRVLPYHLMFFNEHISATKPGHTRLH